MVELMGRTLHNGCDGSRMTYGSGGCAGCYCVGCCGPRQRDARGVCAECQCYAGRSADAARAAAL